MPADARDTYRDARRGHDHMGDGVSTPASSDMPGKLGNIAPESLQLTPSLLA
jgi:hypothetical protein